MDSACDLIRLPWILRKALLVLNSMEVRNTSLMVQLAYVVPYDGDVGMGVPNRWKTQMNISRPPSRLAVL